MQHSSLILLSVLLLSHVSATRRDAAAATDPHQLLDPETHAESERRPDSGFFLNDSIPDYYQRDSRFGGFPHGGTSYCGPTAASNSLAWLATQGYPELLDSSTTTEQAQFSLIHQLGSERYMGTGKFGSSPSDVCRGVSRLLRERGLGHAAIRYQGWRKIGRSFKSGRERPDLDQLRKALVDGKPVWVNLGWYSYDEDRDEYTRTGGHWVTLVGYGHDGARANANSFVVRDPETRRRRDDYLVVEEITAGTLEGNLRNLPREAAGFFRFRIAARRYGIIDGAVIVELSPRGAKQEERAGTREARHALSG